MNINGSLRFRHELELLSAEVKREKMYAASGGGVEERVALAAHNQALAERARLLVAREAVLRMDLHLVRRQIRIATHNLEAARAEIARREPLHPLAAWQAKRVAKTPEAELDGWFLLYAVIAVAMGLWCL